MIRLSLLACFVFLVGAFTSAHAQTTAVVAVSGDVTPDGSGKFLKFRDSSSPLLSPEINDLGHVMFAAVSTGPDTDAAGEIGFFRGDVSQGIKLIARRGQTAPDGDGQIATLFQPALSNSGAITFVSRLVGRSGGPSFVDVLFRGDGTGPLVEVVGNQGTVVGESSEHSNPMSPKINAAGQVVFISGPTLGHSVFRSELNGDITPIARRGEDAPSNSGRFRRFSSPMINDAGQVAFRGMTTGGQSAASGIYISDGSNSAALVALSDQVTPDGNGRFGQLFGGFTLNNAGQVAFASGLIGTIGGGNDDSGIFVGHSDDQLLQAAREGDAAPGGGTYAGFSGVTLNDVGQIAFPAFVIETAGGASNHLRILRIDGDSDPIEVVRDGASAPDGNGKFSTFSNVALNNAGQVAFISDLVDTRGGESDDRGLFIHYDDSPDAELLQVVRLGDDFLGSTITDLLFSIGSGSTQSGLNESGQVAYYFELADGRSGIAVWSIPEPSSLAMGMLVGLAFVATCGSRRR